MVIILQTPARSRVLYWRSSTPAGSFAFTQGRRMAAKPRARHARQEMDLRHSIYRYAGGGRDRYQIYTGKANFRVQARPARPLVMVMMLDRATLAEPHCQTWAAAKMKPVVTSPVSVRQRHSARSALLPVRWYGCDLWGTNGLYALAP